MDRHRHFSMLVICMYSIIFICVLPYIARTKSSLSTCRVDTYISRQALVPTVSEEVPKCPEPMITSQDTCLGLPKADKRQFPGGDEANLKRPIGTDSKYCGVPCGIEASLPGY